MYTADCLSERCINTFIKALIGEVLKGFIESGGLEAEPPRKKAAFQTKANLFI